MPFMEERQAMAYMYRASMKKKALIPVALEMI
jgi:hypothetical protein